MGCSSESGSSTMVEPPFGITEQDIEDAIRMGIELEPCSVGYAEVGYKDEIAQASNHIEAASSAFALRAERFSVWEEGVALVDAQDMSTFHPLAYVKLQNLQ